MICLNSTREVASSCVARAAAVPVVVVAGAVAAVDAEVRVVAVRAAVQVAAEAAAPAAVEASPSEPARTRAPRGGPAHKDPLVQPPSLLVIVSRLGSCLSS